MASERRDSDRIREFRLEGGSLFAVGALIVVVLGLTFFGGRWYERTKFDAANESGPISDPLEHVVRGEEPADIDGDSTYFDTVDGGEKQAEPEREVDGGSADPPVAAPISPPAASGAFYVQVFAGRDRDAAGTVMKQLGNAGYTARLDRVPEGRGALYKVRVGGYAARDEAGQTAERLKQQGFSGAWVTTVE